MVNKLIGSGTSLAFLNVSMKRHYKKKFTVESHLYPFIFRNQLNFVSGYLPAKQMAKFRFDSVECVLERYVICPVRNIEIKKSSKREAKSPVVELVQNVGLIILYMTKIERVITQLFQNTASRIADKYADIC